MPATKKKTPSSKNDTTATPSESAAPVEKKKTKSSSSTQKVSKKPVKKANKEIEEKVKRARARHETFSTYIYKILKNVDPELGISNRGMKVLNNFVLDLFERLAAESGKLVSMNKSKTMSVREVQTAVRLVLPGELAKHAVSHATRAVTTYVANTTAKDK